MSVSVSAYLPIYLAVFVYIYLSTYLPTYLFFFLSFFLSFYLSFYLSFFLSFVLSLFLSFFLSFFRSSFFFLFCMYNLLANYTVRDFCSSACDPVKNNEMGDECSTHHRNVKCLQNVSLNPHCHVSLVLN